MFTMSWVRLMQAVIPHNTHPDYYTSLYSEFYIVNLYCNYKIQYKAQGVCVWGVTEKRGLSVCSIHSGAKAAAARTRGESNSNTGSDGEGGQQGRSNSGCGEELKQIFQTLQSISARTHNVLQQQQQQQSPLQPFVPTQSGNAAGAGTVPSGQWRPCDGVQPTTCSATENTRSGNGVGISAQHIISLLRTVRGCDAIQRVLRSMFYAARTAQHVPHSLYHPARITQNELRNTYARLIAGVFPAILHYTLLERYMIHAYRCSRSAPKVSVKWRSSEVS